MTKHISLNLVLHPNVDSNISCQLEIRKLISQEDYLQEMAQILSRSNINTWGTHQLLTISRNHAETVNPTELPVDDEIRQSSSLSPRTVVHKSLRGHKGQTLWES